MITIIYQRNKCIGCNYCVEQAPQHWIMSKTDGKSFLKNAVERNGFWRAKVSDSELEINERAAKVCPVKIIQINV